MKAYYKTRKLKKRDSVKVFIVIVVSKGEFLCRAREVKNSQTTLNFSYFLIYTTKFTPMSKVNWLKKNYSKKITSNNERGISKKCSVLKYEKSAI